MKNKLLVASTLALAFAGFGMAGQVSAQVFFSTSATCAPTVTSVSYSGTTPTSVHICGTLGSTKFFCGQTLQLRAANVGESGKFSVTSRTAVAPFNAAPYTDSAPSLPQVIGSPTPTADLGASPTGSSGYAAASAQATRLLTSLQITADATATNSSYVLSFDPNSIFIDGDDSGCAVFAGTTPAATLTMNRVVAPATAVFTISSPVNVTEGGATANAVVSCAGALDGNNTAITVPYTLANNASNFTVSPASPLTFSSCPSTQNIVVTPRAADAVAQGAVSGSITLTAPSAGSLGSGTVATVNVADSPAQTVTVAVSPATATEEGGVLTYTFTRAGTAPQIAAALAVTITPPAASSRYSSTCTSPVSFAAAATTATCAVTGNGNSAVDGNINAVVAVAAGAGYTAGTPSSATGTITDDDGPQTVTIAVSPASVAENGGSPLVFTVTRAGGSPSQLAQPLTVNLSGTGTAATSRYSTTCGATLTIAATQATASCNVTPIDNATIDGSATAVVSIGSSAGYTTGSPSSATGTINDDDVAINAVAGNTGSAASMGITEGAVARFSVSCPTLAAPFTVNYSIAPATPATGDVFVGGGATGSVTCPAAAASLVAVPTTVQTLDDSLIGNARTYTMTISVPAVPGPAPAATVIGNAVATVVVADNDQPTSIPTMGAAGLGLLSLMLAGLAAFQRRRRA